MSTAALPKRFQPTVHFKPVLAILISSAIILVIGGIPDLSIHAKVAFITFGLAIVGWTLTEINDTYIALAASIVFAATGIDEPSEFFETLGDPLIWLMFASFIIAAAVKASGLSERLALLVTRYAGSVRHLFFLLTIVLIATAFLVPSTSGRAALMLPVFLAIRGVMPNERVARALSLLFPAIILLSAIASLIGAGAHLITADILWRTGGEYLGFGRWLAMGLPFAIASSFAAMFAILFLFTRRQDRTMRLNLAGGSIAPRKPWTQSEMIVAGVAGTLVLLWATETVHGVNSTLIALIGGLLLTAPAVRVISFKNALKEVDWGMLIFMAATLELGEALIESGGAQWLVDNLFGVFQGGIANTPLLSVALVATFGLLSHLVITSRSSRASVIIPLVIFLATALGFSPTTFAFMTAAATGFCLTLPVSAKPVAMYAKVDGPTYTPRDLLRLSSVLLPVHLVLLVTFAFLIWPFFGLDIAQAQPNDAPAAPSWIDEAPASANLFPLGVVIDLGPNPYREGKRAEPKPGGNSGATSHGGSAVMVPPDKGQVPDSNPISANPEAETEIDREEAFQDEASTWDESEQDGDQAAEPLPAPAIMAGGDGQASSLSPGAGDDDDVESGDDEEDD